MKKNLLIALSALFLAACGDANTNNSNTTPDAQQTTSDTVLSTKSETYQETINKLIESTAKDISTEGKYEEVVLSQVLNENDSIYYGIFNIVDKYDPNANILNGHFGINPEMKSITRHELMKCVVKNDNGKPVITRNDIIFTESDLPGSLGESAKIWFSAEGERKVKNMLGFGLDFQLVDVDQDGTYELVACREVNENDLSTNIQYMDCFLLTLADENGKVNGINNMKVALECKESYHPIQVDLDKKQVFWRRGLGMGSMTETCVDIVNSHAGSYYDYVKEVNPQNESEFEEECLKMSEQTPTNSNSKIITVDEYKKNCEHSSNIFTHKCMSLQIKDSK